VADLALEPAIVEEQIRRLNRQADSLGVLGVIIGAPVGAVIGGLPLVAHGPIPSKFGIATLLLGALLTGTLGYIVTRGRSFGYRLKAQLMLGQLRLEQNIEALLAVSERPIVPALPAPEPVPALPEPPRIEELLDAGLAMPTAAPVVDYTPPVEAEEIAPLPDPEPLPEPEPVQLPSWAADLEQRLAAAAPAPAPRAPAPSAEPEPEPTHAWALPIREEPAPAPTIPSWAELHEFTPAPAPEPTPAPTWSGLQEVAPAPAPEPAPEPTPAPAWSGPQEVAPAPMPEPAPPPVWAVPAAKVEQPEPEPEPEAEAAPTTPTAPPDLSTMTIAEIARLADAGAL
jgi:hypothetical protein